MPQNHTVANIYPQMNDSPICASFAFLLPHLRLSQNSSNPSVMETHGPPSQSAEDYLERIHELIEEKGYARVVDIASSLKVKQASVTSMVQKLGEAGYLNYEKYRGLVLAEKGKRVGTNIQKGLETRPRFCDS